MDHKCKAILGQDTLPGPFDQAAFTEDFGNTAIARVLLPKDVLRSDTGWKTAGADDLIGIYRICTAIG